MAVVWVVGTAAAVVSVVLSLRWVLVRRALRSVTLHLRRRREEGVHVPVRMELVDRRLEELVTEVNAALAQVERAAAARRRHEQAYRELVAELSHDLRTPLTAVRGYQQALAASGLDPDQRARLDAARRHADRLAVLVDEVFEYAWLNDQASSEADNRAEWPGAGRWQEREGVDMEGARREGRRRDAGEPLGEGGGERGETVDLVEEVSQCLLGLASGLDEAGIEVEARLPDALPVAVQGESLRRILANLGRNVVQHGRARLLVEAGPVAGEGGAGGSEGPRDSVEEKGTGVLRGVRELGRSRDAEDSGATGVSEIPGGVDGSGRSPGRVRLRMRNGVRHPERVDVSRVFERHWSTDPAGTGLGLAIVERLAAQVGGRASAGMVDGEFEVVLMLPGA